MIKYKIYNTTKHIRIKNKLLHIKESTVFWLHMCFTTTDNLFIQLKRVYIIVFQSQDLFLQKLSIFPLKITIDTYENQTSKKETF